MKCPLCGSENIKSNGDGTHINVSIFCMNCGKSSYFLGYHKELKNPIEMMGYYAPSSKKDNAMYKLGKESE